MTTENSTTLEVPDALKRKPIIDLLDEDQVKLIAARAQAGSKSEIKRGELAAFLELAASYQLDPFSGEVWLAKGRNDKVLIMVGRDGLRKIAQRNGLVVDGDVIHENDDFQTRRNADGSREVMHVYGHPKDRGPIVGAWCEVRTFPSSVVMRSRVMGFFVATVNEYKPTHADTLKYSPWGSQESVMILAAAERQALRQATPLSGLVAQGELDRSQEPPIGEAAPEMTRGELGQSLIANGLPDEQAASVCATVRRAQKLGHAGHGNAATVEMLLRGQPAEKVEAWLAATNDELDAIHEPGAGPREDVTEAVVVDGDDGDVVPAPDAGKVCAHCGEAKPDDEFTAGSDECASCVEERVRAHSEAEVAEQAALDEDTADPAEQAQLEGTE